MIQYTNDSNGKGDIATCCVRWIYSLISIAFITLDIMIASKTPPHTQANIILDVCAIWHAVASYFGIQCIWSQNPNKCLIFVVKGSYVLIECIVIAICVHISVRCKDEYCSLMILMLLGVICFNTLCLVLFCYKASNVKEPIRYFMVNTVYNP